MLPVKPRRTAKERGPSHLPQPLAAPALTCCRGQSFQREALQSPVGSQAPASEMVNCCQRLRSGPWEEWGGGPCHPLRGP